ncbi:MAG: hypothetical protein HXY34_10505 [Candidatus Thorarchaeota archaeon]|nr:hypothetical protein [Candidatus Thorarchaeota archaeon]
MAATKKGVPLVFRHRPGQAPAEIAQLSRKEKATVVCGNNSYVATGLSNGEVEVWAKVDWTFVGALRADDLQQVTSLWMNPYYLVAATTGGCVTLFDLKDLSQLGKLKLDAVRVNCVHVDGDLVIMSAQNQSGSASLLVFRLVHDGEPFDVQSPQSRCLSGGILMTSPYDVLESVLELKEKGNAHMQAGQYELAARVFENALRVLVDGTHALLELPQERAEITAEINQRLGRALLRVKLQELGSMSEEVARIADEFKMEGRSRASDEELKVLWERVSQAIREARALADAQATDLLSYQLTELADTLEQDTTAVRQKIEAYRETVNQARAIVDNMTAEWSRLERRRSSLSQRRSFLEAAVLNLEKRLSDPDNGPEVKELLDTAAREYRRLLEQITRIISAKDAAAEAELGSRDEARAAIEALLRVVPKKRDAALAVQDPNERAKEVQRLVTALQQALETATRLKLKDEIRNLENQLAALRDL